MNTKKVYSQLTNVDIEKEKILWDERGKGYYGEYLVFCELYKKLIGTCKILMNLNIPTSNGKTTEIDLLLIHETGIYVFEVKHYKGTIYGKDTDKIWTQYFRTAQNNSFKNPMLQNEYHLNAVKKMFPNVPVRSVVVFTNEDCTLKVINSNPDIDLCRLDEVCRIIEKRTISTKDLYTTKEIDYIFSCFSKYSNMKELVLIDGEEKSFIEWLNPIIMKLELERKEFQKEKNKMIDKTRELQKRKKLSLVICMIVIILSIYVSSVIINDIKSYYNNKLSEFKQNFLHVDEINNEYIHNLNEYVNVSDVSLVDISSNAVSFKAKLTISNDVYGIALTEESKYIVMTSSNKVYEYNVFGNHLVYNRYNNTLGKGIRETGELKQIQFFGVIKDDITYIKITDIEMFKLDVNRTKIKDNLELELYQK